jgi:hypothetical protein
MNAPPSLCRNQRPPALEFWIEPSDLRFQIAIESQPPVAVVRIWDVRRRCIENINIATEIINYTVLPADW